MAAMTAHLKEARKKSLCRFLCRYHALSPPTTKTDISRAATHMWGTLHTMSGLKMACTWSVTTNFPLSKKPPAGVCIQELATTIQNAERDAPRATIDVAKR